jgi:hypothetical protein
VQGLAINRSSVGIRLGTNGGNAIVSNHIGTDLAGTVNRGNRTGIEVDGVPDNRIENNLISGNNNNLFNSGFAIEIFGICAQQPSNPQLYWH